MTLPLEFNAIDADILLQENLNEFQVDEIFETRFKDEKHNVWKMSLLKMSPTQGESAVVYHYFTSLNLIEAASLCLIDNVGAEDIKTSIAT